jgi:hypothetical protein
MGNVTKQIMVGLFCTLALSGTAPTAKEISTNISEETFAQHSSEVLSGMREFGEKHGFAVAMEIENGNGKYILHIKQRHNETTKRGLLHTGAPKGFEEGKCFQ